VVHALAVFVLMAITLGGCGYAGRPPLPSVTVSLEPGSAVVGLGQTQQFQAMVTSSANTAVLREVNGVTNGNAISGTVSDSGLYTAPLAMPGPAGVTVTVVSVANPHDEASAVVTLQDGIAISVQPPTATVVPGGAQVFAASISGTGGLTGGATWSVNGAIRGRIVPANPFALATLAAPSPGVPVSGMVGAHVVAVDAETGSVIAGTLGGWSCDAANPPTQFDGSFDLERLPIGHTYNLYAEPLLGLALLGDFSDVFTGLCSSSVAPTCTVPPVNTNFNVRILPATQ
jgi:hypothetical protein